MTQIKLGEQIVDLSGELPAVGSQAPDFLLADLEGNIIGHVTSGTYSPTTGKNIGMGYVPAVLATEGSEFAVVIRDKHIKAQIVKLPFVKK